MYEGLLAQFPAQFGQNTLHLSLRTIPAVFNVLQLFPEQSEGLAPMSSHHAKDVREIRRGGVNNSFTHPGCTVAFYSRDLGTLLQALDPCILGPYIAVVSYYTAGVGK